MARTRIQEVSIIMQSLDGALCTQTDPDLWFPREGSNGTAAKRICRACPVRAACLEEALASPHTPTSGIRAGYGVHQLAAMRARRRKVAA